MHEIEELVRQKKKQTLKLQEIEDFTIQLASAFDRRDEVSVKMLLSMRQEPILRIEEIEEEIQTWLLSLSEEDAIRCRELFEGGEPSNPGERLLSGQVELNRKLLERIVSLDKRLSVRVGGNRSFYETKR